MTEVEAGSPTSRQYALEVNGNAIDLTGATITARIRAAGSTEILEVSPTVDDAAAGLVSVDLDLEPGAYTMRFLVTPAVGDPFKVPDGAPIEVKAWERD